ncbi:hypothetical protein [Mangrovimonas sp. DI 80]|uniref:hypothetical protein n=1 Tax=Mangrovimonas sp. DI 80 TaxID=1779330 RepID=UPI000977D364|nr:hypothetical protein [Mangrovimonas sp. DI 80]
MKLKLPLCVFMVLGCSLQLLAQETNYKFENYGNRSVLLLGNVTGSVNDLGLTYYNPSRLALAKNTTFTINAKAYDYSRIRLNNNVGPEDAAIRSKNFDGIPSMVAGTFKFKGEQFAYSSFSKFRNSIDLNYDTPFKEADIVDIVEGNEMYSTRIKLKNAVKDEWVGITWAKSLNDRLSIGVSGFFSIYRNSGGTALGNTVKYGEDKVAYFNEEINYSQESYGLFWKIGASYRGKGVDFGMTMSLPYWELLSNSRYGYNKVISGVGTGSDQSVIAGFKDLDAKRKQPFGLAVGAGIPLGKSMLHLNVEWFNGLNSYSRFSVPEFEISDTETLSPDFYQDLKSVVNFGAGAEIYVRHNLNAYVSFSTDYSAEKESSNFFDLSSSHASLLNMGDDFLHMAAGFDYSLKWGRIILGGTYANGSSEYTTSLNLLGEFLGATNETSKLDYTRWRFVVGIEVPFFDNIIPIKKDEEKEEEP